jgi:hypothetical protein
MWVMGTNLQVKMMHELFKCKTKFDLIRFFIVHNLQERPSKKLFLTMGLKRQGCIPENICNMSMVNNDYERNS